MQRTIEAIASIQGKPWTNEMAQTIKEAFSAEADERIMNLALGFSELAGKDPVNGPAPLFIIQAMACRDWAVASRLTALVEGLV